MKSILISFFLLPLMSICYGVYAQYTTSPIWMFGDKAGIDFTSGNPIAITTNISSIPATAAIQTDTKGNVLFYANATKVWDKNGNMMPNSLNAMWPQYPQGATLQTRIVRDITDTSKYYLFNQFPCSTNPGFDGMLTYSILDMKLNNGLGDIVPGKNNVVLDNSASTFIHVLSDGSCGIWITVQDSHIHDFDFKSYKLTATGVNTTPVVSSFPMISSLYPYFPWGVDNRYPNMVYSYKRNKLFISYAAGDLYSYDFNPSTGVVSNPVQHGLTIPVVTSSGSIAVCLSPDEDLLYTAGYITSTCNNCPSMYKGFEKGGFLYINQWPIKTSGGNISLGQPVNVFVTDSFKYISTFPLYGWSGTNEVGLRIGPDGKMYVAYNSNQKFLGRINNPNAVGVACNHTREALALQINTYTSSTFPAPSVKWEVNSKIVRHDTSICFTDNIILNASIAGADDYTWSTSEKKSSIKIIEPGIYWCSGLKSCDQYIDTFRVLGSVNAVRKSDTTVCTVDSINLSLTTGRSSYHWNTGDAISQINITKPGIYWCTSYTGPCAVYKDTFIIKEFYPDYSFDIGESRELCNGEKIKLGTSFPAERFRWNTGDTTCCVVPERNGRYILDITDKCGNRSDTSDIEFTECYDCMFIPTAFSPNNDGLNDGFGVVPKCAIRSYRIRIFNRWGELVFASDNLSAKWDGSFNGSPAEIGAYFYYVEYTPDVPDPKQQLLKGDMTLIR